MKFKEKIKILRKFVKSQEPYHKKYEKDNYLGNELEKMLLRNAIDKKALARDENTWYEIIGKEKIYLGTIWNFALNWSKRKKIMWGYK